LRQFGWLKRPNIL